MLEERRGVMKILHDTGVGALHALGHSLHKGTQTHRRWAARLWSLEWIPYAATSAALVLALALLVILRLLV